jgi:hypothetical protein
MCIMLMISLNVKQKNGISLLLILSTVENDIVTRV